VVAFPAPDPSDPSDLSDLSDRRPSSRLPPADWRLPSLPGPRRACLGGAKACALRAHALRWREPHEPASGRVPV